MACSGIHLVSGACESCRLLLKHSLFAAFFFPDVYQEIDWARGIEFLDKELNYAVRVAGRGRRSVDKLAHDPNPFAIITLAHLKTLATQRSDESRFEWKVRILDYLYEQEWPEDQMADLVRCLDLMMPVTKPRQDEFDSIWRQHEEKQKMPTAFLSNIERKAMKTGREEATLSEARSTLLEVLDAKYGRAAEYVAETIKKMGDVALLRALHRSAVTAPSLDDFRKLQPSG